MTTAAYANIIVETRGKVGIIRLNRPRALHALNAALMTDVGAALARFEANADIGCLIITGSEQAFAAGADIREMAEKTLIDAVLEDFAAGWDGVARARKPILAAVAGYARGQ